MEYLARFFPHTPDVWVIQIVGSIIFSYFLLSFAEYLFHRYLMHQGMPQWVYEKIPPLQTLLTDHKKLHHQVYYHQFDFEPDQVGKDINLRFGPEHTLFGILFFAPLLLLVTVTISALPAIVFVLCAYLHALIWNIIHTEMHQPKHPFWSRWGIYKFLARQHFLHHHDTHTGFNIVLPFFDAIFCTVPVASAKEQEAFKELGFEK